MKKMYWQPAPYTVTPAPFTIAYPLRVRVGDVLIIDGEKLLITQAAELANEADLRSFVTATCQKIIREIAN
jgi:hypothetical protein